MNNKTLREYINETSNNIVTLAVDRAKKLYLGELLIDDYKKLIEAFNKHMSFIQESI